MQQALLQQQQQHMYHPGVLAAAMSQVLPTSSSLFIFHRNSGALCVCLIVLITKFDSLSCWQSLSFTCTLQMMVLFFFVMLVVNCAVRFTKIVGLFVFRWFADGAYPKWKFASRLWPVHMPQCVSAKTIVIRSSWFWNFWFCFYFEWIMELLVVHIHCQMVILWGLDGFRYVGNIHVNVTEKLLAEVFQSVGPLAGCKLIRKDKVDWALPSDNIPRLSLQDLYLSLLDHGPPSLPPSPHLNMKFVTHKSVENYCFPIGGYMQMIYTF